MEYRPFGQTGLQVSAIGFGCWELGGGYGKVDESEYTPAVHRAIDLGINCFDTAEAYGFGVSERALARALGERRQDVMVVTKFGVGYQEAAPSFRDSSRQRLMDSIEKSLSNLNTDYVDVYMVHWPDIRTPFDETMRAFDDIVLQGKARFVGISNLRLQQLETCMQTRRIDVVQYCWNMLDRRMSKDIYPYCHEHNIGVMAYGSLAYGMLTGTFTAQMEFDAGDWRRQRGRMGAINLFQHVFAPEHFPRNLQAVEELKAIAAEYGKTLPQLGLRWTLANPVIGVALVGCRTPTEVEENIGALGWSISATDMAEIDALLARYGVETMPDYWIESD
ncbi:MAG: aldo/keto reductase [Candidatus Tectomicrobia bacterium]